MPDETEVDEGVAESKFSRRSLIKAGAIVGGTVWVAPVIDSFTARAAAASATNYCCYCLASSDTSDCTNFGETSYQCINDDHPPSPAACASLCQGFGLSFYIWCGPGTSPYTCGPCGCSGNPGSLCTPVTAVPI